MTLILSTHHSMNFILRFLGNSTALYLANQTIEGFVFRGDYKDYLVAGALLTLLNLALKPILKILVGPLIWLTLGLFTLVINGAIIWVVDYFLDFMAIQDYMALIWTTVIVSLIGIIIRIISK